MVWLTGVCGVTGAELCLVFVLLLFFEVDLWIIQML